MGLPRKGMAREGKRSITHQIKRLGQVRVDMVRREEVSAIPRHVKDLAMNIALAMKEKKPARDQIGQEKENFEAVA